MMNVVTDSLIVVKIGGQYWPALITSVDEKTYTIDWEEGSDLEIINKDDRRILGTLKDGPSTPRGTAIHPDMVHTHIGTYTYRKIMIRRRSQYWPARVLSMSDTHYVVSMNNKQVRVPIRSTSIIGPVIYTHIDKVVGDAGVPFDDLEQWLGINSSTKQSTKITFNKVKRGAENKVKGNLKTGERLVIKQNDTYCTAKVIDILDNHYIVDSGNGAIRDIKHSSTNIVGKVSGEYAKKMPKHNIISKTHLAKWVTDLTEHKQTMKPTSKTEKVYARDTTIEFDIDDKLMVYINGKYWPVTVVDTTDKKYITTIKGGEYKEFKKDSNLIAGKIKPSHATIRPRNGVRESVVRVWIGTINFTHHQSGSDVTPTTNTKKALESKTHKEVAVADVVESEPVLPVCTYDVGDSIVILLDGTQWPGEVIDKDEQSYTVRTDDGTESIISHNDKVIVGSLTGTAINGNLDTDEPSQELYSEMADTLLTLSDSIRRFDKLSQERKEITLTSIKDIHHTISSLV